MRALAGKLLKTGIALTILTSAAVADPDPAAPGQGAADQNTQTQPGLFRDPPMRLGQNQVTAPDPVTGQDPIFQQQMGQPGAIPPPPAEIPKPFHGSISFEAGSGKIVTLTLPAANIYVADPKVAEVRPASSTSLFVFGVGAGRTTIAAVDVLGRLLADYQITVRPSGFGATEAQSAISRLVPGSRIQVKAQGKGLILSGGAANAADAAQASMIAKGFLTEGGQVENQVSITAATQVTLQVRIAEMKRSTVRNLGINWAAGGLFGKIAAFNPSTAAVPLLTSIFNNAPCVATTATVCFDTVLNALAQDGLAHILAEPNLTVMSGQPATFQAGGEYPYPVATGSGASSSVTIQFKPYGVLLNFVPTVMNDGRINLHVRPEVSTLDTTNQVNVPTGSSATMAVPALSVRRAETTVELGSGESFAIAGMLQNVDGDNNSGIPGLGDTPVIGALFKTNNLARQQTELVIIVTPLLVRPVKNVAQLQVPAQGYSPPGDIERLLLMRQVPNRDGTAAPRQAGSAGFIVR